MKNRRYCSVKHYISQKESGESEGLVCFSDARNGEKGVPRQEFGEELCKLANN